MNTELQVFQFKQNPVRILKDGQGKPWWVAKDVCDILGIKQRGNALNRLRQDEKGVDSINTPGGVQKMSIINEPGLYQLILRSDKPEAKEFQYWVTHDVLPSIRKKGYYSQQPMTELQVLQGAINEMVKLDTKVKEHDIRITRLEDVRKTAIALLGPVSQLSDRAKVNMLIRGYAKEHGNSREDYRHYYNDLFYQFYYREHVNLKLRTKNNGNKFIMDTAEQIGAMPKLVSLASEIFK